MTEIFFYHLLFQPLEQALPALLEKSLERDWRAIVQCSTAAKLKALDDALWTYSAESFLPHATSQSGEADNQPILLTTDDENGNDAVIRMFVEQSASIACLERSPVPYKRALLLFDGRDDDDVKQAREHWRIFRGNNYPVTYWQQEESGRWRKNA